MGRRPGITLPQFIYRFSTIPIKIAGFHAEIDQPALNVLQKLTEPGTAEAILKMKNKVE